MAARPGQSPRATQSRGVVLLLEGLCGPCSPCSQREPQAATPGARNSPVSHSRLCRSPRPRAEGPRGRWGPPQGCPEVFPGFRGRKDPSGWVSRLQGAHCPHQHSQAGDPHKPLTCPGP